jgi:hypothetical protein
MTTVSLPVLPANRPLRLTPTDVSQFVRLEQCERFLRFRLAERAGQKFMVQDDVAPQRITPLLSLSGHEFGEGVEETLGKKFASVSATESYRAYLLASYGFLLDPRRLTVALRRAKRKMILVASRSIFSLFSTDEETFNNSLLWKNLLLRTCSTLLWEGERAGKRVAVWGGSGVAGHGET